MSAQQTPTYDAGKLFGVENIVAVVTGGGSGLGRNIAHALAVNGAKAVYVLGRREDSLKTTASTAPSNGNVIHTIVCDVTSKDQLTAAATQVRSEQGYINVLFANSGVIGPNQSKLLSADASPTVKELQDFLWETSVEDFSNTLHVNVTGAFFTAVAFLDLLDEGNKKAVVPQKSQIIVTSSIAAFSRRPSVGFPYSASKSGVTAVFKQFATVLAPFKIRSNIIAPGFYPSEMTMDMSFMKEKDPRVEGNIPSGNVPLARSGSEEDIAGAALFLASRAGAYVDGNVLLTDGGRLSAMPSTY